MKELLPRRVVFCFVCAMDVPPPRSLLAIAITIEGRSTIDVSTGQGNQLLIADDNRRRRVAFWNSSTGFTESPRCSDEDCQSFPDPDH